MDRKFNPVIEIGVLSPLQPANADLTFSSKAKSSQVMKHLQKAALVLASAGSAKAFVAPRVNTATFCSAMSASSFYDLSGEKSDGSALSAADLKGKVVYATNVASR